MKLLGHNTKGRNQESNNRRSRQSKKKHYSATKANLGMVYQKVSVNRCESFGRGRWYAGNEISKISFTPIIFQPDFICWCTSKHDSDMFLFFFFTARFRRTQTTLLSRFIHKKLYFSGCSWDFILRQNNLRSGRIFSIALIFSYVGRSLK